jgi:hypothetical protein
VSSQLNLIDSHCMNTSVQYHYVLGRKICSLRTAVMLSGVSMLNSAATPWIASRTKRATERSVANISQLLGMERKEGEGSKESGRDVNDVKDKDTAKIWLMGTGQDIFGWARHPGPASDSDHDNHYSFQIQPPFELPLIVDEHKTITENYHDR